MTALSAFFGRRQALMPAFAMLTLSLSLLLNR